MIYAGAAVNWLGIKVNQFTAARSWHSDPGLRQAVTLCVIGFSSFRFEKAFINHLRLIQLFFDKENGQIKISKGFSISKSVSQDEILAFFEGDRVQVNDMQNGWTHIIVQDVKAESSYFNFIFYYNKGVLRMVDFIVSDNQIVAKSWNEWNQEKELEKSVYSKIG